MSSSAPTDANDVYFWVTQLERSIGEVLQDWVEWDFAANWRKKGREEKMEHVSERKRDGGRLGMLRRGILAEE